MLCVLTNVLGASAFSQDREVFADSDTQTLGTDQVGPLGPEHFGDRTDIYSGATTFSVTDVSLPGNSHLSVTLQRSLQAFDDGIQRGPPSLPSWTNFEVPYLSGIYKSGFDPDSGWRTGYLHTASLLRCSITGGAPEVTQSAGKDDSWEDFEYWHGNHLYLPGGRQDPMLVVPPSDPSNPTSGGPYYWATRNNWQFSCLSATANAAGGEGFLGIAPNGDKYFFNWLVTWREAPRLTKESFIGGPTMLSRSEYRMLVTRIEDRFGNWVNYSYSGKNLTSIAANDGRQLTLTYDTAGTRLASVTDGTRTWTYAYTSGVQVTHPDGRVWSSTITGPGISRNDSVSCASEAMRYSGEYTVAIQQLRGATGTFNFRALRRGISWVPRPLGACPSPFKFVDNISLNSKTISGPGLTTSSWSVIYGPPNACYTGGYAECTAASPTTRIVDVLGPQSTFTRYTFGNRHRDTEGLLQRVQTGTSAAAIVNDEQLTWNTIPVRGIASGGGYLASVQSLPSGRTITRNGATYSTTFSNYDEYYAPRTIVESGPNGGSRTTQITYNNNKSAWVLGKIATSTTAGDTLSRSFFANGSLQSVTRNGVTVQVTYHPDGNVASITYPRGLTYSFSNYKLGIPQAEAQPEGITRTRVVNSRGYVTSETDGEGRTTAYGFDVMGRLNLIDYPIGNDVTLVHTALSTTLTRGPFSSVVTYDGLGRSTRITSGGIATDFEYDAYNRITFRSNPGDSIGTRLEYDVLGRLKKVTNPDGTFSSNAYGAASVTSTDERSRNTTRTYRSFGDPDTQLLMSTTAPVSAANVSITRLANGLIDTITQGGVTRDLDYDARNYLLSETNPETGVTSYVRDDAGNVTSRTIGGLQTAFTYDGQNRLKTITYPDATPAVTNTYTKTNRLKSVTSSVASRVLGYDQNDNLLTESLTIDGNTLTATYGYSANNDLSSITYPVSGRVVSYSPDTLGRPTQVSGYVSSITYWGSGLPRDVTYTNGMVNHYDKNERLMTSALQARRGSTYYLNSSYDYDDVGNLSSVTDSVEPGLNRTLDYDGIDRLTTANGSWGAGSITYDGAGNIRSQNLGSFGLTYSYNAQNRLQSVTGARNQTFAYDVQGNVSAAGTSTFVYNAAPTLTCALCSSGQPINYAYDGLNQRVKATKAGVTTYEFYDSGGKLLVSHTPSQANKLVEYIYLGGKRIAQRVSDQNTATSITPIATTVTANQAGGVAVGVNVGGTSPSGSVAFAKQGTVLGTAFVVGGSASVEVSGLAGGLHSVTAMYSGDANNSGNGATFNLTVVIPPDTTPPSAPGSPTFGNVAVTSATASWTAATDNRGVVGYDYRLNSGSWQSLGNVLSVNLTGLAPATTYTVQVRARDAATNLSTASSNSFTTPVDNVAPSVPTGLSGVAQSQSAINLTWNASSDNVAVTGYRIYRNGGQIGTSTTTSYSDSGRAGFTTYSYQVAAYDAATNVSALTTAINVKTPDQTAPTIPASLSATAVGPSKINLSWGASTDSGGSGLAGYRVYRGGVLIASPTTNSYSDTGLTASTAYSYTVAAYDNATPINTSGQSTAANATTLAAVTASLSTGTWRWRKNGSNPTQIDPPVVCTGSGGTGSGYTYAWQRVSGDTETTAVSPTSSSTRWSRTVPEVNATYTSTWRCLVTDSGGNTGQNTVTVTFIRNTIQ